MFLNLASDLAVGSAVAYPDISIRDQRKKLANGGAYVLQYGRAFLHHYLSSGSRDFYNGHKNGRYGEALRYAKGQQDAGQYAVLRTDNATTVDIAGEKWIDEGAGKRAKLDKRPLQLLPKYVDAVLGLLKAREFAPSITPLDTLFEEEKASFEAAIRAYMLHGEFIKSLGLGQPVGPDGQPLPAELPVDEEDLDLFMADFKGKGAMKLEIETVKSLNNGLYADQDKQCQYDDAAYGSSVIVLAQAGTRRVPRRWYPGKCFFLPSDTGMYDNLQAGAHIESITLGALLAEMEASGYTLKKGELDTLKGLARPTSRTGSYEYSADLDGMPEAGGTVEVVRFSFLSTDRAVKVLGTDKMGNPNWIDKPATYTNPKGYYKEVKTQDVVNVYEGTLVVQTEIGYGARLAHAQIRDTENPFVAHPFYVVTSPGMHGGISDSLVERARPMVDMAAREFMKLQDALSKLPDSAIAVNLGMLAQVTLDGGKTNLTGKELMASYFRDGVFAYNGVAEDGTVLPVPLAQIPIDITQAVSMRRDNILWCVSMIEQITGANGAVAGANVESDQGAATTKLAIEGSQNTLEFLFFAKQTRFERVCRALAANIKANDPELAARTVQVKVEQKPTEQQWLRFYQSADTALAAKEITLADYTAVTETDNLKEARRLLASRAKRKRMQDAEDATVREQSMGQVQINSAKAAEEEKRLTIDAQLQADMQRMAFQRESQLLAIQAQTEGAIATARIGVDGKLEGIQAQSSAAMQRDLVAHTANKTMADDKLDSAEDIAQMQAQAAASRPAAGK